MKNPKNTINISEIEFAQYHKTSQTTIEPKVRNHKYQYKRNENAELIWSKSLFDAIISCLIVTLINQPTIIQKRT